MSKPIKIEISKSTGKVTHVNKSGVRTVVNGLPPKATIKAVEARLKAMRLAVK